MYVQGQNHLPLSTTGINPPCQSNLSDKTFTEKGAVSLTPKKEYQTALWTSLLQQTFTLLPEYWEKICKSNPHMFHRVFLIQSTCSGGFPFSCRLKTNKWFPSNGQLSNLLSANSGLSFFPSPSICARPNSIPTFQINFPEQHLQGPSNLPFPLVLSWIRGPLFFHLYY